MYSVFKQTAVHNLISYYVFNYHKNIKEENQLIEAQRARLRRSLSPLPATSRAFATL